MRMVKIDIYFQVKSWEQPNLSTYCMKVFKRCKSMSNSGIEHQKFRITKNSPIKTVAATESDNYFQMQSLK